MGEVYQKPVRVRALGHFRSPGGILFGPLRMRRGDVRVLPGVQAGALVDGGFVELAQPEAHYGDELWDRLIHQGLLVEGC